MWCLRTTAVRLLGGCLGALLGACSAEADIHVLLANYYDAHDARATAFCGCFHGLVGYKDADTCRAGWEMTASEKGCIDGIFAADADDPPRTYSSAPAIECITGVETDYAGCIDALACEDTGGLDACVRERNAALLECPRLSAADTEAFETCRLL